MITSTTGNLLTNDAEALVNTVNLDGVMGKGIALQFAKAFPEILPLYEAACRSGELAPGRVQVIERPGLLNPRHIINVPTKRHWRGKSRMADIKAGLADFVRVVRERGIRSIAVPPLGCGLGGLAWADVRPRIEQAFAALPEVEVRLFAPAGAPAPADQPNRTAAPALTAARARVIQVLGAYLDLGYELSLLEVQKLLYFLQGAGDDLKLAYGKNRFGPYADNLRHVLKRFEGHYTQGYGDGNDAPRHRNHPAARSAGEGAGLPRVAGGRRRRHRATGPCGGPDRGLRVALWPRTAGNRALGGRPRRGRDARCTRCRTVVSIAERPTSDGIALLEVKGGHLWGQPKKVEKGSAVHPDHGRVYMVGRRKGEQEYHFLLPLKDRLEPEGVFQINRLRWT